jgi:hypothetical protein
LTRLPVLEAVSVDGYAMYPGTDAKPGLHASFLPGLTLVIGANGLGKTTLVTMIFYLLAGPFDIQNVGERGSLGTRRLDGRKLPAWEASTFAARVIDGAREASATITFTVGDDRYVVTRGLAQLSLQSWTKNGATRDADEDAYQREIVDVARVGSFGEFILLLRLLVFYFEDRRALVWDRTAQVQLLRLLFLTPEASTEWSTSFREVLELDSLVRNLNYAINKEEKMVARSEIAVGRVPEIRQRLKLVNGIQDREVEELELLNDQLVQLNSERQNARLTVLRSEQVLESASRSLQRLELRALENTFPDSTETFRYIVAQILSDQTCLTCSSHVPDFAAEIEGRLRQDSCPVCASHFPARRHAPISRARLTAAEEEVTAAATQLSVAQDRRNQVETAYDEMVDRIAVLTASTAARDREIDELTRQLPPDEARLRERRHGLNADKARLASHRERLARLRQDFDALQSGVNAVIATSAEEVKQAFDAYATGFLLEDASLTWTTFKDRIGEGGMLVDFPAFELDMSGAGFSSPVRRSGPASVSESQREFIDLSFRMALMDVATGGAGTLLIDAPESSLDAVFVTRASEVLTRFATSDGNKRLVVASNLVDGDLVPDLLAKSDIKSPRSRRVIDLLRVAAPTAATTKMHDAYVQVRERIFRRAGEKRGA